MLDECEGNLNVKIEKWERMLLIKKVNIDRKGKYILCISSKKKSVELK